jgi:hypothetical protein
MILQEYNHDWKHFFVSSTALGERRIVARAALYLTIHHCLPYARLWCILPQRSAQLDALPWKLHGSAALHQPVMLVIFLVGVYANAFYRSGFPDYSDGGHASG